MTTHTWRAKAVLRRFVAPQDSGSSDSIPETNVCFALRHKPCRSRVTDGPSQPRSARTARAPVSPRRLLVNAPLSPVQGAHPLHFQKLLFRCVFASPPHRQGGRTGQHPGSQGSPQHQTWFARANESRTMTPPASGAVACPRHSRQKDHQSSVTRGRLIMQQRKFLLL